MFWSGKPFVRIFFLFLAGVLLVVYIPALREENIWLLLSFTISFLIISLYFTVWVDKRKFHIVSGIFSGMLTISLAVTVTSNFYSRLNEPVSPQNAFYVGRVIKEPSQSAKAVKVLLEIESYKDFDESKKSQAKVMVFIEKDSLSQSLTYGDKIVFSTTFKLPGKPLNPGEFDYARFLELNLVRYVAYIPASQWSFSNEKANFSIFRIAAKVRHFLLKELNKNGLSGEEYAVTAAILLGYDNLMEFDLEQNYRTAGAMHILVVSGLHVGIIFLVFNFLLNFLNRSRKQKMIKMLILFSIIWFYAMLTGLAPSVQRASIMVSMFIFADATSRFKNNFNTLAASAVLLMLFNPLVIFNVGFQLSYAAVFGILFFYQPIYRLLSVKNKFLRVFIWQVVVVSFSAQIATFPIAAHYFHFFPVYFLFTNIVVFPMSFLIISAGLFFISVFWIPFVSEFSGFVLAKLVFMLNFVIGQVKYFPFSEISDLYFPLLKVVLVYSVNFTLFYWLILRKARFILPFLIAFFLVISFGTYQHFKNENQESLVIFDINNFTAIDFINGNEHVLLTDSAFATDQRMRDFYLKNYLVSSNLSSNADVLSNSIDRDDIGLQYDENIAIFKGFRLLILDKSSHYLSGIFEKPRVDAVLVTGRKKVELEKLLQCFEFDKIIVDATVPIWKKKLLEAECDKLEVSYFDSSKDGAFITQF